MLDAEGAGTREGVRVNFLNAAVLNSGDAAILQAAMQLIEEAIDVPVSFAIYAQNPRASHRSYPELDFRPTPARRFTGGSAWARMLRGVAPWRFYLAAWCIGRGLSQVPTFLVGREADDELRQFLDADVIVASGGTYLVEHYPLSRRVAEFRLALHARRPLVLFTQSLGPFRRRRTKRMLGPVLRKAALIMVRDERSRKHLDALRINPDRVRQFADAAFALSRPPDLDQPDTCRSNDRKVRRVAVSVRDWPYFTHEDPREGNRRYQRAIATLVETLVEDNGSDVTFISTCQGTSRYRTDDSKVAGDIAELLPSSVRDHVQVDRIHRTPIELVREFARFDLVVATRMHVAILALVAGTPAFPIAYEFKTAELAEHLGLGEWVQDIQWLDAESLTEAVTHFIASLPELRCHLFAAVERERVSALSSGQLIRTIIGHV